MSVNYYLDSPDNDAGHIGKYANGRFIAKAPDGVDSWADWVAMLDGHRIFAEHGIEYTPEEMVRQTEPHPNPLWRAQTRRPHYEGEFMERGILFVRYEFC